MTVSPPACSVSVALLTELQLLGAQRPLKCNYSLHEKIINSKAQMRGKSFQSVLVKPA